MFLEWEPIGDCTGHQTGRALLGRMYEKYVGGSQPAIAVTERGKPYWPDSIWHFSISHTKHHVFCALSRKNIGIDAEEIDRTISRALAERILSPREKAQWEAAPDQRLALLTFWVLKEAYVKMTGEGLKGYPKDTDFLLSDPRVRRYHDCLVAVIEEEDHVI